MNHKVYGRDGTLVPRSGNYCHPERSLAKSAANRQTKSKDPVFGEDIMRDANFRVVVRFFDEQETEPRQINQ